MSIPFGTAEKYTIAQGDLKAVILTYGAIIQSLQYKGRELVLNYPTLEQYRCGKDYRGAIVGRVANSIIDGRFSLNGVEYQLSLNDGEHHHHGGFCGLDRKLWQVVRAQPAALTLRAELADGEEGYPANLWVEVTYEIKENALSVSYRAQSDGDTIFNPTSHSYFNLGEPKAEQHLLQIFADEALSVKKEALRSGAIEKVEATALDFRTPALIGSGKDHNYILRGEGFRLAAVAESPKSGVRMECFTDRPGLQLYINGGGFCLESQAFPNAPNHPEFPSALLKAGELFCSKTEYRFSTL